MSAVLEPIDRNTWERREHFDYYVTTIKCRYDIGANIDITRLRTRLRERGLRFYPAFLHVLATAINRNREFRMGLDAHGNPGFWDICLPSYTIFHADDKTFSDIWTPYAESFTVFYANAVRDMDTYKDIKGLSPKPGRPANACPMSCVPWLSFTSFALIPASESTYLFPITTFGKYFEQGDRLLLPLAVSVHHAAADGYHTCKLINDIQAITSDVDTWLS